jgi:hypothetical protein
MGELLAARILTAPDPVGLFLRAAGETLLRVAALSLLAGLGWALLSAMLIYGGATRARPRVAPGRVWAEWRRRPFLWAGSLALGAAGTAWTAHSLCRELARRDLYWIGRADELYRIGWLGGLSGYLLGLLLLTVIGLAARRGARRRRR